jgi:type IV secretory pathway VirB4 component
LLTPRKQNAVVVLVAHNIEQIQSAPDAAMIWELCPTRIFLPNADAAAPAAAASYAQMGLGEREITTIAKARPNAEQYYRSSLSGRLFELSPNLSNQYGSTLREECRVTYPNGIVWLSAFIGWVIDPTT